MAPRTVTINHQQEVRERIKTSQLINRLQGHVLGEFEMPATAVTAALGLIRKTLPDLTATEHSGEQDLSVSIGWKTISKSITPQESNSSPSTTEPSASPASSATEGPEKP